MLACCVTKVDDRITMYTNSMRDSIDNVDTLLGPICLAGGDEGLLLQRVKFLFRVRRAAVLPGVDEFSMLDFGECLPLIPVILLDLKSSFGVSFSTTLFLSETRVS